MTARPPSVHEDLAFMKALVETGASRHQAVFGEIYLSAGLLYGFQTLVSWGQALGVVVLSPAQGLAFGVGVTVVFLAHLSWALWRSRDTRGGSTANRAISAAFGAAGMTNLVLLVIFGMVGGREHSLLIWLLYPTTVFALQGGCWFLAFTLRRRAWLGVVALGWFATAVAMAATLATPAFVLITALGLFAWMVVPGAVMLHLARKSA